MMTNLFSIFDPTTKLMLSSNWISTIMFMMILPLQFWMLNNRYKQSLSSLMKYLFTEFSPLIKKSPYILIISSSLFMFIMMNNSAGLLPYIFTASSHIMITLPMALSMWMGLYLYSWLNNYYNSLTHLIPQGTPAILMPFMVIIETVSNIIRPGTLAVRLAANMIAGHLLLVLLSSSFIHLNMISSPILFIFLVLLSLLEMAVAIIQAYVFTILISLYCSESVN
uniref:ATP synthase subunit a n=1 Tax=Pseudoniphargus unisexualis TaxID=2211537 RepID=A0A345UEE9_9CRUS|nr:ATP synthase F0 subunit 6 [Pseudoniphargus unisexualis]